jgi:ABC transport system ATP-binding/permease protein
MSRRLTVQILPSGPEQSFAGDRPILIGRDAKADVVVSHERASRRHAVVRPDKAAGWVLEDLSSNGTFSGGSRLNALTVNSTTVVHLGHPRDGVPVRLTLEPPNHSTPGSDNSRAARSDKRSAASAVSASALGEGRSGILGEFSAAYEPANRTRIGRAPDNDIVIPDLLVSRHHAELRQSRSALEIVDLGSSNGVFLDGTLVQRRSVVHEGSIISIGHHLFQLSGGRLEEYVDSGNVDFAAMDLTVRAGNRLLLDGVSFALAAGQLAAVLGPTGAGKSTLTKALIGSRPADLGWVLYNGRNLYTNYDELRYRIGYVPQDDLLHPQLTVRGALEYASALRFPPDVDESDRRKRVEEIMAELGLSERAGLVVSKLSGGQRKRTSVAIELLTRPSLIVLDEPTSGLDPGYEKSVMELLRSLADGGRTVITVTHSVQSLERCDRVLFLAPGGQTAFFGTPDEVLPFFGMKEHAEVFQALDRAAPGQAKAAFTGSKADDVYVQTPLIEPRRAVASSSPAVAGGAKRPAAQPRANLGSQFVTLVRRYLSVIVNDRRNTALLLLQAPVLGFLMMAVLGHGNLNPATPGARGTAQTVLVALILGSTYLGASNSVREIVKERGILTRELSIGVSPAAYILSKAVVLGALTVLQAFVLVVLGLARQGGPGHGALFSSGRFELFVVVALTGVSAMAIGLLVSALVSNADKALTILPVILFAQFLMTGAVFNLQRTPVLSEISYVAPAKWGYSAAASTANLDAIEHLNCNGSTSTPGSSQRPSRCDGTHRHAGSVWVGDNIALVVLTLGGLGGAWRVVVPLGKPSRRRGSRAPVFTK